MLFPLKDYNPTRTVPVVTVILIATNIIIFLLPNFMPADPRLPISKHEAFIYSYGLIPWELTHGENISLKLQEGGYFSRSLILQRQSPPFFTLFYSLFLHGGLLHLLGNMLFLWIFGNNIEDTLGKIRFIFFYLLCGVGSTLVHVLFNLSSQVPVIGASGAISGVMGAYLILFPKARIRTLVFLFIFVTFADIPAALFLIVWFIFQFAYAGGEGGIAWLAHVGGFVLGIYLLKVFYKRKRAPEIIEAELIEEGDEDEISH